jgi:hypothetical protein
MRGTAMSRVTALWIAGLSVAATFAAALIVRPAQADGFVTMHGTACKPTTLNASVMRGSELWNGGSKPVDILCPLYNHWGGGNDLPTGISRLPPVMYFGSNAPNSAIHCTLTRQDLDGNILGGDPETTDPTQATGTGWKRTLTFPDSSPALSKVFSSVAHNYYILCSLPAGSALYTIRYQTKAVSLPD